MRKVAKFFLWLITLVTPFVIAACYGAPQPYRQGGRVLDARSRVGVAGLKVTCVRDGQRVSSLTLDAGAYVLPEGPACDLLVFEDVDGRANGAYAVKRLPGTAAGKTVDLQPTD